MSRRPLHAQVAGLLKRYPLDRLLTHQIVILAQKSRGASPPR